MTKAELLQRLDDIGQRFVAKGIGTDRQAFRERGIAWGVACSLLSILPQSLVDDLIRTVEREADRQPYVHHTSAEKRTAAKHKAEAMLTAGGITESRAKLIEFMEALRDGKATVSKESQWFWDELEKRKHQLVNDEP